MYQATQYFSSLFKSSGFLREVSTARSAACLEQTCESIFSLTKSIYPLNIIKLIHICS